MQQEEIVIWGVLEASGEFFILQLMSKRDAILHATSGVCAGRCIRLSRSPRHSLDSCRRRNYFYLAMAFRHAAFEFGTGGRSIIQT